MLSIIRLAHVALVILVGVLLSVLVFPVCSKFGKHGLRLRLLLSSFWYAWGSYALGVRLKVTGIAMKSGGIFACNHISWLDVVVVGGYLPLNFIAKSEVASWPVLGFLAKQSGTLFIRRDERKQARIIMEKLVWLLKQNEGIALFPEGTTTRGETVLDFHSGLFQSCVLTGQPVQPVAIRYLNETKQMAPFVGDDDFISSLKRLLPLKTIEMEIHFCEPIQTKNLSRQVIANSACEMIRHVLVECTEGTGNANKIENFGT